uniref:Uncharacterized protein n=1 Tax=Oryza punctata TaxID=4537 RepID=A0A0E0KSW9_ORYPU
MGDAVISFFLCSLNIRYCNTSPNSTAVGSSAPNTDEKKGKIPPNKSNLKTYTRQILNSPQNKFNPISKSNPKIPLKKNPITPWEAVDAAVAIGSAAGSCCRRRRCRIRRGKPPTP